MPDDDSVVGRLIANRYLIEEACERTSRSTIYRAHHLVNDRSVLVRILEGRSGVSREVCRDALAFAERASSLPSPHLARTLDVGVVAERWPFVVSEYSKGKTLAALVEQGGPLPLERVLPIARQLASVLGMAHMARVVYGAVRLDGIWVESPSGRPEWVRVLDFGVSELPEAGFQATRSGVFPSTAGREGAVDGFSPGAVLSDIQSLGAALYELATGGPVNWAASDIADGLDARFSGTGWSGERALVRGFALIVERCLGSTTGSHYRSMQELSVSLEALTDTAAALTSAPVSSSQPVTAIHTPARRAHVALGGPKVIVRG